MKKEILLVVIIAVVFGVAFGADYLRHGAALETLAQAPSPAPGQPAAPQNGEGSVPEEGGAPEQYPTRELIPSAGTVTAPEAPTAIAAGSFALFKDNYKDVVGEIQYGMQVEVLERRAGCLVVPPNDPEKPVYYEDEYSGLEGQSLDCYRVRKLGKEGWLVNRGLLDFRVRTASDDPNDLSWFFQRYGESTWYYEQLTVDSFTEAEYEKLLVAGENGAYQAQDALRVTLGRALQENPNDPKLARFKERVKALLGY